MNLYEAITTALEQCKYMFENHGAWTGAEYTEMVKPLHEALLNMSQQNIVL